MKKIIKVIVVTFSSCKYFQNQILNYLVWFGKSPIWNPCHTYKKHSYLQGEVQSCLGGECFCLNHESAASIDYKNNFWSDRSVLLVRNYSIRIFSPKQ